MVGEGQVEYFGDRSPGEPPSAFITEGFFSIPGGWKLDSPKPESFEYRTLDGCPSRVLECFWSGDLLTLTVGPPRELELHVHDLIGSPVAEAEIQVFASLPYRGNLMKTNSEGVAVVSTYSNDPTISVRVTAAGYDRLAMSANTQVTARLDIPLRRLFGVGIVHRPSPMIQDMGGVSPGDGVDYVEGPTLKAFEHAMRALAPPCKEDEQYIFVLVAEKRWLEQPPSLGLSYAPRGRGQVFERALNVALHPLATGLPGIVRVPESAYPERSQVHSVLVRLSPADSFLAEPPASLSLRFTRSNEAEEPWDLRGVRMADTTYRFSLPPGEFEISSRLDEWDFYEQENARILPGVKVLSREDAGGPVIVTLAPDERWVLIDLRDPAGREVSVGALLAPSDAQGRRFSPNSELFPYGRFIRPGHYDLWFMNFASLKPDKLLEGLSWPAATESGGRWILQAPVDRFPAAAFASMMR